MRIKIPVTAASVFETDVIELAADPEGYGLDADERAAYALLAGCLVGGHLVTPEAKEDRDALFATLTALSNAYDDQAVHGHGEDRRFANNAARSLSTLAVKVLRA